MSATPKQRMALYYATKLDNRGVDISFEEASELISESKAGGDIYDKLIEMGCKDNRGGGVRVQTQPKANKNKGFQELFDKAYAAGLEAGRKHNPTPMVVSAHVNPMDDSSPVTQSWHVSDGLCGFAWVIIRPATSSFARYLKAKELGRTDSYHGGLCVWVSEFNQSYERKVAFAHAFANVLCEAGIKAYAYDRLD